MLLLQIGGQDNESEDGCEIWIGSDRRHRSFDCSVGPGRSTKGSLG